MGDCSEWVWSDPLAGQSSRLPSKVFWQLLNPFKERGGSNLILLLTFSYFPTPLISQASISVFSAYSFSNDQPDLRNTGLGKGHILSLVTQLSLTPFKIYKIKEPFLLNTKCHAFAEKSGPFPLPTGKLCSMNFIVF